MKKRLLFFASFLACYLFIYMIYNSFLPDYVYIVREEVEPKVYVTVSGEKYHSEACHYLYFSKKAIGKEKAIQEGYTACSYCKGDSFETIAVEYKKPIANRKKTVGLVFFLIALPMSIAIFVIIPLKKKKAKP